MNYYHQTKSQQHYYQIIPPITVTMTPELIKIEGERCENKKRGYNGRGAAAYGTGVNKVLSDRRQTQSAFRGVHVSSVMRGTRLLKVWETHVSTGFRRYTSQQGHNSLPVHPLGVQEGGDGCWNHP